jgi:hypothetical protein
VGADPDIITNRNLSRLVPLLLKWDSIETVVGRPEDDVRADVNVGSESNTPTIGADPDSMVKSATRTDDDVTSHCFQDAAPMKENVVSYPDI